MTPGVRAEGWRIRVWGQVQGVGFRPFIWQLAREMGLRGRVLNDAEGVLIEAAGPGLAVFVAAIRDRAPLLARIDSIDYQEVTLDFPEAFEIAASGAAGAETRVTPDAATCPDCVAEINAPGRRQGYAFTNCTHCGPRFTILQGLPYDRARTTMAAFPICDACRAEYENPGDRRFHAQPVACPDCGPRIWLEPEDGDPIAGAVSCLQSVGILSVKGLGGFHLACDARRACGGGALAGAQAASEQALCADGHAGNDPHALRRVGGGGGAAARSGGADRAVAQTGCGVARGGGTGAGDAGLDAALYPAASPAG